MNVKQLKTVLSRIDDDDEVRIVNASKEYQLVDAFDIPDGETVIVVLTTGTGRTIKTDRRRLFEW